MERACTEALCGQALFANSNSHVVLQFGKTRHFIPHDGYKVSNLSRGQNNSTQFLFFTSFNGMFWPPIPNYMLPLMVTSYDSSCNHLKKIKKGLEDLCETVAWLADVFKKRGISK